MTLRRERRKQRSIVRKRIPPIMDVIEGEMRTNAQVFLGDAFEAPYIAAAYYLIRHFVSKPVADQYFRMEGGQMTSEDGMALTTVGETIFELRNKPCIIEFCRRLGTRQPRAAFFEVLAARIFMENGFAITAIAESGVKGEDFDFRARKDGRTVCVEVTTLTPPAFSETTIENAFKAKVSQMRPDKPGVIVCVIPEAWFDAENAVQRMVREARRLFGKSKRINAVLYLGEQHDEVDVANAKYGMLQFRSIAVMSEKARNPCEPLDFLARQRGDDLAKDPLLSDLEDEMAVHRNLRARPFFQWVDELVGRSPEAASA